MEKAERWYWIAVNNVGKVRSGSQRTMEGAQRATKGFEIRAYSTDKAGTHGQAAILKKIWHDKVFKGRWDAGLRRKQKRAPETPESAPGRHEEAGNENQGEA